MTKRQKGRVDRRGRGGRKRKVIGIYVSIYIYILLYHQRIINTVLNLKKNV